MDAKLLTPFDLLSHEARRDWERAYFCMCQQVGKSSGSKDSMALAAIERLLRRVPGKADLFTMEGPNSSSSLAAQAVHENCPKALGRMLMAGADPDAMDGERFRLVVAASVLRHEACAHALLDAGASNIGEGEGCALVICIRSMGSCVSESLARRLCERCSDADLELAAGMFDSFWERREGGSKALGTRMAIAEAQRERLSATVPTAVPKEGRRPTL